MPKNPCCICRGITGASVYWIFSQRTNIFGVSSITSSFIALVEQQVFAGDDAVVGARFGQPRLQHANLQP